MKNALGPLGDMSDGRAALALVSLTILPPAVPLPATLASRFSLLLGLELKPMFILSSSLSFRLGG